MAVIGNFEERVARWTLSPFVGSMFRWSEDLAGGGAVVSAGLNTAVTIPWGERWETSLIAQISDYRGIPFDVDGYELDKVVDQQVLKVGAQAVYRVNTWLLAETYVIGNRFLQEAAVQDWFTFGVGLQARLSEGWAVRGAYVLDKGPDYVGNSGRLQLNYAF